MAKNMYSIKHKATNILLKLINKLTPIRTVPLLYIYDSEQNLIAKEIDDGYPSSISFGTYYIKDMGDVIIFD